MKLLRNLLIDEPIYLDSLNTIAGYRSEYEVKKKIVSELEKLKSDKPGYANTISIDCAIGIVNKA